MDVVILFNGLGNQMSQYAFYLKKKKISRSARFIFSKKSRNIHNGFELENVFGIKYSDTLSNKFLFLIFRIITFKRTSFISKFINKGFNIFGVSIVFENDDYDYNPEFLKPAKGIRFYVGGWHSEKYFKDIAASVRQSFQFKVENLDNNNLEVLDRINKLQSVSVHVRRGDFLDINNFSKFGSVCTLEYFRSAIEKMMELVEKPHFFFFTNDHEWVETHFNGPDFTIININKARDSWKDMFLISKCMHNIDSNGSFSWWSSWLNKNAGKIVIVPKFFIANKFLRDIYPENWLLLDDY